MITCRHPVESDLDVITQIWNDSRAGMLHYRRMSRDEVRSETFGEDDYDPEGAWIAYDGDEPVGYAEGLVDRTRVAYGRNEGYARVEVIHAKRGLGIERDLMDSALDYLRTRGVKAALYSTQAQDGWRNGIASDAGFKEARRFYMMLYRGTVPPGGPTLPTGIHLERAMTKGASDETLRTWIDATNDSFSEHFNFSPWTVERIRSYTKTTLDIPSVTFAYDGKTVVGAALNEDSDGFNRENGTKEGWIAVLGVVKSYRGRGLGKALLVDGIRWLMERGLDTVRIGVDAQNRSALDLYTSVGFEVTSENISLRKEL